MYGQEENIRQKRIEGMGATQITFESIYCGLLPRSITAGCLTFQLTEIAIGLMYLLSTRPSILLRDCSQLALTRPLKRQGCQMTEWLDSGAIEMAHDANAKTPIVPTRPHEGNLYQKN